MSSPEDRLVLYRGAPRGFSRPAVSRWAERLRTEVAGGRGFRCLVAGDRELRRLNRLFLGRGYPADVLAFPEPGQPGESGGPGGEVFLGEIAVSAERALEQAAERGHAAEEEIAILLLHGLLHLMGMDHETDRGKMARAERRWRRALGLGSGLIERSRR
jgi:probable rRNA maturation factor